MGFNIYEAEFTIFLCSSLKFLLWVPFSGRPSGLMKTVALRGDQMVTWVSCSTSPCPVGWLLFLCTVLRHMVGTCG